MCVCVCVCALRKTVKVTRKEGRKEEKQSKERERDRQWTAKIQGRATYYRGSKKSEVNFMECVNNRYRLK